MNKTKLIFLLFLAILFAIPAHAQTISCTGTLASVSACLTPGQWGEVTGMTGMANPAGWGGTILNTDYVGDAGGGGFLNYQNKAAFNPQTNELYVLGGAHGTGCVTGGGGGSSVCQKGFVKFNGNSNSWSRNSLSSDVLTYTVNGGHQYQYNTIDPVNQDFYYFDFSNANGELRAQKFHIPTSTWTFLDHDYVGQSYQDLIHNGFEFFPDRKSLTHYAAGATYQFGSTGLAYGTLDEYTPASGWVYTPVGGGPGGAGVYNQSPFASPCPVASGSAPCPLSGTDYSISHYNNVQHVLYFGGGGGSSGGGDISTQNQWYQLDKNGIYSALPSMNSPGGTGGTYSTLEAVDPVTGTFIVWSQDIAPSTALFMTTYKNGDSSWNRSTVTASAAHLITPSYGGTSYEFFNEVTASDVNHGVILILQHNSAGTNSDIRLFVYKYAQKPSFSSKCSDPAVLGCWPFDNQSEITYYWDQPNSIMDAAMAPYQASPLPISGYRVTGEARSHVYQEFASPGGAPSIDTVDTGTKFEGAGSLKFPTPQYSGETVANFQDNFNKTLGYPNVYISKGSPNGNIAYLQFMARFSDSMINDDVPECGLQNAGAGCYSGPVSAAGIDSLHLICTGCTSGYGAGFCIAAGNPSDCPQGHTGKHLFIFGGTNLISGSYTITSVVSTTEVVLDRSPSNPGTQGLNGTTLVENVGGRAGGWKVAILLSNANPVVSGDPGCDCVGEVMNDGNQHKGPQFYDNKGTNAPGAYQNVANFLANTWNEITVEVIVGDSNVANTEVKWWVDGQLAYDWTTAKLIWEADGGNGLGLGQIVLLPFQTRRDPFYPGSADGAMWIDNAIVSKAAIPFNSDGGGNVVPCSSPSKVVFTSQPSSAVLGASLGPVVGQIQDSAGVLCNTATNAVTLAPHTGATWSGLAATSGLTKAAAGGVVTWTDLTVSTTPGSGSIDASASGLTPATSNSFNITNPGCSAPSKLVFTAQPSSVVLGAFLNTVTVQIQDSSHVPCNTATNTITLAKDGSATWGLLQTSSTLTKAASGGVATWTDLYVSSTPGSGSIAASASGLTGAISTSFNVTATAGPSSLFRRTGPTRRPPLIVDAGQPRAGRRRPVVIEKLAQLIGF